MNSSIDDQVIEFYGSLFECIFSEPFHSQITIRLKRNAVIRQVEEAADAASQSLTRFFVNQELTKEQVANILEGFVGLGSLLKIKDIANPNVTPEAIVDGLLIDLSCPKAVQEEGYDIVYRVALHSVVQVLALVGPVMAEWQKLKFASTFELPRRIVNRLNQISEQLDVLGHSGQVAADERYELSYRDYLLQRFYRIEAGTVRMATNMDVDLRELFVMPKVWLRLPSKKEDSTGSTSPDTLMGLPKARKYITSSKQDPEIHNWSKEKETEQISVLEQVKRSPRNVIIGAPGAGKSTFLEWLQVKLASVEEELVLGDQQAIPLLLRVRQLDPKNLPHGVALIEKATASQDRAVLMPLGWIDRQMQAGRVLLMLDGLDETEPEWPERYILPWLRELCQQYPKCWYLITSRPVGYSSVILRDLEFVECELLNFGKIEINEYTRHWCTAVRLAQNEPEKEARREGETDGERIVDGFKGHPFINHLARNPLMLSAICLVNYFGGGQLPTDRARLYGLCVEGLLHYWDQRRGIRSEFTLDEKLRACREVALAMQTNDWAEYEAGRVQRIFEAVLGDPIRAEKLLQHVRYRTGLLLERRSNVFAFAHLTFQEYLAACAIHEGNQLGIDVEYLASQHEDGRWQEVIALYCGLAPVLAVRAVIERLITEPNMPFLSSVLAEAYLSASPELKQDHELRRRVIERIAVAPGYDNLQRFELDEVRHIANQSVGKMKNNWRTSEAYRWLYDHPKQLDEVILLERVRTWQKMKPTQLTELIYLLHRYGLDTTLATIATDADMYAVPGPRFVRRVNYGSQAEIALLGLSSRIFKSPMNSLGVDTALLQILRVLSNSRNIYFNDSFPASISEFLKQRSKAPLPQNTTAWPEFASLARTLAEHLTRIEKDSHPENRKSAIDALNIWAERFEHEIAVRKDVSNPDQVSIGDNI